MTLSLRTRSTLGSLAVLSLVAGCAGSGSSGGSTQAEVPTLWRMADSPVIGKSQQTGMAPLAPEVVRLDDGRYRMYYNDVTFGVASAISTDGLNWQTEPGLRLASRRIEGEWNFDVGHVTALRLKDGRWRLFYGSCSGIEKPARMHSAVSTDGLNFTDEGVRVDIGGSSPFTFAGHGRVWRGADDVVRMLISANTPTDTGPSDTALMESRDEGLTFSVVDAHLFPEGHDPAVVLGYGGKAVTALWAYLVDGFQTAYSYDGVNWSAPVRVDVIDSTGSIIDYVPSGDVVLLTLPNGELVMYGNWSDGIRLYTPVTR